MNLDGVKNSIIKGNVYSIILSNDEVGVGLGVQASKQLFTRKYRDR